MSHNILIAKLNHYGIRGITLDWFQSYLTNRKQQTSISKTLSNETMISYGVPQGSVGGTLLFLIYINRGGYRVRQVCQLTYFSFNRHNDMCL